MENLNELSGRLITFFLAFWLFAYTRFEAWRKIPVFLLFSIFVYTSLLLTFLFVLLLGFFSQIDNVMNNHASLCFSIIPHFFFLLLSFPQYCVSHAEDDHEYHMIVLGALHCLVTVSSLLLCTSFFPGRSVIKSYIFFCLVYLRMANCTILGPLGLHIGLVLLPFFLDSVVYWGSSSYKGFGGMEISGVG